MQQEGEMEETSVMRVLSMSRVYDVDLAIFISAT